MVEKQAEERGAGKGGGGIWGAQEERQWRQKNRFSMRQTFSFRSSGAGNLQLGRDRALEGPATVLGCRLYMMATFREVPELHKPSVYHVDFNLIAFPRLSLGYLQRLF